MHLHATLFCLVITNVYGSGFTQGGTDNEPNNAVDTSNTALTQMQKQIDSLQTLVLSLSETMRRQNAGMKELQEEMMNKDLLIEELRELAGNQEYNIQQLHDKVESHNRQIRQLNGRTKRDESHISALSRKIHGQQSLLNIQTSLTGRCTRAVSRLERWIEQYLSSDDNYKAPFVQRNTRQRGQETREVFRSGNHSEARSDPQGIENYRSRDHVNNERLPSRDVSGSQSGSVAFSAYLTHNLFNLGPNAIIPFQGVVVNEGNAYNSNVGVFTTPRDGLYLFSFALEDMYTHILSVRLVVDGQIITGAVVRPSIPGIMAFNLAIVRLTVGQSVWVAIDPTSQNNSIQGSPESRVSTFSGVYLH